MFKFSYFKDLDMAIDQNELRHFNSYTMHPQDPPPPPPPPPQKKNPSKKPNKQTSSNLCMIVKLMQFTGFSEDQRVG